MDSVDMFEYLYEILFSFSLVLGGAILLKLVKCKRNTIEEQESKYKEIQKKNVYLEHAAKIIRHDMHSGINTYLPRGIISLERRLPRDVIDKYRIGPSLRLLKEGLEHTQQVYDGVYAFTDLVKKDKKLPIRSIHIGCLLEKFLDKTAYSDQVQIDLDLMLTVNPSLFCTAIDNLVRNGLSYNDSKSKYIKMYVENESTICIEDNGRGLSKEDFLLYCKPYSRKTGQAEAGSGLGLNIAKAILNEHKFKLEPEKISTGTIMRIYTNESNK